MNNKNVRKKFIIIGALVLLLIIVIVSLIFYLSGSKNDYSFLEKNWINDNVNNVIDIEIANNMPVFSNAGEGVLYDYLNDFETDTGLSFNKISSGNSGYEFKNKKVISDNDLVFYKDHYVLISTSQVSINSIDDLKNQEIGVLTEDLSDISYYLSDYSNVTYTSFASFTEIKNSLEDDIIYAIVPLYLYINEIIYNDYNIILHLEGLNNYFVLSMPEEDSRLNNIFRKFSNKWSEKNIQSRNDHLLELYYDAKSLTDLQKETITNDDYIIGFIDNLPYEGKINRKFSGVTNEYLEQFSLLTGCTYKYIEYSNLDSLVKALNNKKVDLVFNNYLINNTNYSNSLSLGEVDYVVLAHKTNDLVVDSVSGLKNVTVNSINNTSLNKYLTSLNIKVDSKDNLKKLLDEIELDTVLVVEKEIYDYYKNNKLSEFSIRFIGNSDVENDFLLNNDNNVFNNLFNFYLSLVGNKKIEYSAINNSLDELSTNVIIVFLVSNITYVILLLVALGFFFVTFKKKIRVTKKIKKEDKLMYLDVLTNLKNRNYLNDNIEYWEANKVYPQAVITIDLCRIKELNDAYGHKEGDNQIKSAANILIKTQRENSEIIRTDGNEFLIYLVGYEEKFITTYMHKLTKEFANLPHKYGASVGYSMITDEIKTIDDAINESLIMMRKNKELQ